MQPEHTILGGGIVGLMTAYFLSERGVKVTVIDAVASGDRAQTSYGNAGVVALGSVMPLGEPGLWFQGIKMLLETDSSLAIPWRYRLQITPWLLKVLRESSSEKADANARAIAELSRLSGKYWHHVIQNLQLQDLTRNNGWLKVFEQEKTLFDMSAELKYMDEYGFGYQLLTSEDIQQLEPSLAPIYKQGVLQTDSLSLKQPDQLLRHLEKHLRSIGVQFIHRNIDKIQQSEKGFLLQGTDASLEAKQLSVCCGAWSQRLLSSLGCQYPLETERGYHLMFDAVSTLQRPVIHTEQHIVLCPMNNGLRMTAGVELAGLDAKPNYQRIRAKVNQAKRMLPELNTQERDQWLGFRPSMPDSNPIISAHPTISGLYMAFGHGHLGITQSAATGHLLAQTISNEPTEINSLPYHAARFS